MTDRTTKALLLAIAIGLWGQLLTTWTTPAPVSAQSAPPGDDLATIATHIKYLSMGQCLNRKLC